MTILWASRIFSHILLTVFHDARAQPMQWLQTLKWDRLDPLSLKIRNVRGYREGASKFVGRLFVWGSDVLFESVILRPFEARFANK